MHLAQNIKQALFYDRKNVSPLFWIYLSHLTRTGSEKVVWLGHGRRICCLSIISRVMCSKSINVIGLNLCLEKTVYVPYMLVRTRLKRQD